jgi:hypothetical protein
MVKNFLNARFVSKLEKNNAIKKYTYSSYKIKRTSGLLRICGINFPRNPLINFQLYVTEIILKFCGTSFSPVRIKLAF